MGTRGRSEENEIDYARILYTKHLTKKKKTYHDGFLKLGKDRTACLLDEAGQRLETAKMPAKMLPLSSDTEGQPLKTVQSSLT